MRLEFRNIHKTFGQVHANNDVSFVVEAGTIHGLLGENGAGKSTLVKMLTGFISRDSGEILFDDKPVLIRTPVDGIRQGVGMLHQDPLDFPALTVLENFRAMAGGRWYTAADLRKLAAEFNFDLDPEEQAGNLTVGERQQIELLRLLALGVRTLVLDEPTTGISAHQKDQLFAAMRTLAGQGKSVIFVSHKLEDVEEVCDYATVMRRGGVVGSLPVAKGDDTLAARLVDMMFGRELALPSKPLTTTPAPALVLEDVVLEDERLSIHVPKFIAPCGEVIGLAGLEGIGQRLFILACAGVQAPSRGQIHLRAVNLTHKPYAAYQDAGVCYVPADRMREGLVPGLTIQEHVALRDGSGEFFLNTTAMQQGAERAIAEYKIRGTPTSFVERLSGGNQQRTQLALMPPDLKLILMEHPTRGLDIDSTIWIWKLLIDRCAQGATIMFASSDLDEIVQYSDRVLVFSGGQVSEPISTQGLTADRLGEMIGGKF
ncbi:MAG: ATP-binding cassette domain-containing protein [Chloroflexi bacterium]|nr:ATP-binding cassette domain-containing protein [Chloroflexota bacterium]